MNVPACARRWGEYFCALLPAAYHRFIMEECLGSFITEAGCLGDLGAGGPAQRAPMMLKR